MITRRDFIKSSAAVTLGATIQPGCSSKEEASKTTSPKPVSKPNILYVFSDQWRHSDHGYAGNEDVITPHLDKLAGQSVNFTHAVSGIPVCCPHRATLITGKYPLTHGLYLNDLSLAPEHRSIAHCLNDEGYNTAWIGKWHIDGQGRENFTPPERRQGFEYWRTLECTHNYNKSPYYGDSPEKKYWEGYDAIEQTKDAQDYIERHADADSPFALFLSWGPPHAPYQTAPQKYHDLYADKDITLRKNVPDEQREEAIETYKGYYAHMTALDDCMGDLLKTLDANGLTDNTIVVYTSDHGDMLHSRGFMKKQQPWDESLRIPFLLRWPEKLQNRAREISMPLDTPDIMPTLLGLAQTDIPDEVEGMDHSKVVLGTQDPDTDHVALITCPSPFGQWSRAKGGREYRGVRTTQYTYCRDLNGPWLLYDNEADPFQMDNLVNKPAHASLQKKLDDRLNELLTKTRDEFLPGPELIKRSGYVVSSRTETVDYKIPFNTANITKSPLA
ncbi:sulfatase-like hydrolase/transferase [Opitutales bacterium]|jgi:arylsulfatase A-like enzyme|nr:sulfatase-like hydrolase/transferase [Opitutales bacterium]